MVVVELACDKAKPISNANTPIPRAKPRRVVVVAEDDYALRTLVSDVLSFNGFTVYEVGNGMELTAAVERLGSHGAPPELIVTDIDMPRRDGLTAIAALGGAELPIPFIVITAFASDDARLRATSLGAAAVLSKPFSLEQLSALALKLTRRDALC